MFRITGGIIMMTTKRYLSIQLRKQTFEKAGELAILFPAILIVIVLFTVLTLKATGKDRPISLDNMAAETEYVDELREVLIDHHIKNAGITLTKTSMTGEDTEYTVMIHTRRQLSQDLLQELCSMRPDVANATVSFVFDHFAK